MKDKEKIRAEIEKVKVVIQSYTAPGDFAKGYRMGQERLLKHFENFVYSMQEVPISEDLEDAAYQYANCFPNNFSMASMAFIKGGKWQKQQIMKNAKDGVITFDYYGDNDKIYGCIAHDSFSLEELGLKDGDKVKLIIIKEDEQ
jgi:hypothetical protein